MTSNTPTANDLSVEPNMVSCNAAFKIALRHLMSGELLEAESICQEILKIEPNNPNVLHMLGVVAFQAGMFDVSVELINGALDFGLKDASAHYNMANAFKAQGMLNEAIEHYNKAINLEPGYAIAFNNLGDALQSQGYISEAIASYRKAVELDAELMDARGNLVNALAEHGLFDEAIENYKKSISLNPKKVINYIDLSAMYIAKGRFDEAVAICSEAIPIDSHNSRLLHNLGCAYQKQGKLDAAAECYRLALQEEPGLSASHCNLGEILKENGHLHEAIACYRAALSFNQNYLNAYNNLGAALMQQAKFKDSLASFREALTRQPDLPMVHSNLIFVLDLIPDTTAADAIAERRKWDEIHTALIKQYIEHSNVPDPERRLKIGYVSADLIIHSAAKVFGAMLVDFNPSKFDVYAYSNTIREDYYTSVFKSHVTHWRDIAFLSDNSVAEMIRDDEIDILVDLSGHSASNRLLVFARKPAPIQITAWGYATGTGLRAMDVFFADPVVVPPHERHHYTEDVCYLPNVVGYFHPETFPTVNELPAFSAGHVTFGSFNRLEKVTDDTIKLWANVMLSVHGSKIIIKSANALEDEIDRIRIIDQFAAVGISAERVILQGKTSWDEHMKAFNQIDFALDPYPHGGGVTTLEGLMMGIPTITLRCPTIVGRLAASILSTLGLYDWIAETAEDYIQIAVRKSQDLAALATLRAQLRNTLVTSVIGDQKQYVDAVENTYRQLWCKWCERKSLK